MAAVAKLSAIAASLAQPPSLAGHPRRLLSSSMLPSPSAFRPGAARTTFTTRRPVAIPPRVVVASSAASSPSPSSPSPSSSAHASTFYEAPTASKSESWVSSYAEEGDTTTSSSSSAEDSDGSGDDFLLGDDLSRQDLMHEAVRRLADTDVAEAASKYHLEDELFGEIDFARINAFTTDAFGGNPAAVCYLPYHPSDEWLQRVAAEFNLSETAFLVRRRANSPPPPEGLSGGDYRSQQRAQLLSADPSGALRSVRVAPAIPVNEFDLRWFTPTVEVKLCGHATLAAAHLLFSSGLVDSDEVIFHTFSGPLAARRVPEDQAHLRGRDAKPKRDAQAGMAPWERAAAAEEEERRAGRRPSGKGIVELDFPLFPPEPLPRDEWAEVEHALGLAEGTALFVGRTALHDFMVHIPTTAMLLDLDPPLERVQVLHCRGVMVTAAASHVDADIRAAGGRAAALDPNIDFVSRFFAPQSGIDEDPVTGSSFCTLGPYWSEILGHKQLLGYQASSRPGMVAVRVDEHAGRAYLEGWAVLVMAGVIMNTATPSITHPATS
eukprot:TRINITY_DN44807_c0_g1_i1.p2 TRINITY_DN44807_c0_g1~~TRINITY_DN44807_c0_g1_i1.p2  ORF type:complete len:550 (+),score=-5.51 TRINITY_DN44807_c0_g1_i1:252-1901(+)